MCCEKDSIVTRCFFSPRLCSVPFFDPPFYEPNESPKNYLQHRFFFNNRSVTQRDQLSPQIRLISWDIFNFNQVMKTNHHGSWCLTKLSPVPCQEQHHSIRTSLFQAISQNGSIHHLSSRETTVSTRNIFV